MASPTQFNNEDTGSPNGGEASLPSRFLTALNLFPDGSDGDSSDVDANVDSTACAKQPPVVAESSSERASASANAGPSGGEPDENDSDPRGERSAVSNVQTEGTPGTGAQRLLAMDGIDLPEFEDLDSLPAADLMEGADFEGEPAFATADDDPQQLWLDETAAKIFMEDADKPRMETAAVAPRMETKSWPPVAQMEGDPAADPAPASASAVDRIPQPIADVPPPAAPDLPAASLDEPEMVAGGTRDAGVKLAPGWKPLRGQTAKPELSNEADASTDAEPGVRMPRQDSILDGFGQFLEETVVMNAAVTGPDFMALDATDEGIESETTPQPTVAKLEDSPNLPDEPPSSVESANPIVPTPLVAPPQVRSEWLSPGESRAPAGAEDLDEGAGGEADQLPWDDSAATADDSENEAPSTDSADSDRDESGETPPPVEQAAEEVIDDRLVINDDDGVKIDMLVADDEGWPAIMAAAKSPLLGAGSSRLKDDQEEMPAIQEPDDSVESEPSETSAVAETAPALSDSESASAAESEASPENEPDETDVLESDSAGPQFSDPANAGREVIKAPMLVDGEQKMRGFSVSMLYGDLAEESFFDELDQPKVSEDADECAEDAGEDLVHGPDAEALSEAESAMPATSDLDYDAVVDRDAEKEIDSADATGLADESGQAAVASAAARLGSFGGEESNPLLVRHGVRCPACAESLRIQARYLGIAGKCPGCEEYIVARRQVGGEPIAELAEGPAPRYAKQPDVEPRDVPGGTTLSVPGQAESSTEVEAPQAEKPAVSDPFSNPNRAVRKGASAAGDPIWGPAASKSIL